MPTYLAAYCWNTSPMTHTKPPSSSQKSTSFALTSSLHERRCSAAVGDRENRHGHEFADREEGDEGQGIHAREVRLAIRNVHGSPQDTGGQSGE